MKNIFLLTMVFLLVSFSATLDAIAAEKVIYGFEDGDQGWLIPEWACGNVDYSCGGSTISADFASEGKSSLKFLVNFPGRGWGAGIVENEGPFDWKKYNAVACDIYLPKKASPKLRARIALTLGDSWTWTEMSKAVDLKPGEWTTVTASIATGNDEWKKSEMVEKIDEEGKVHGQVMREFKVVITDEMKENVKAVAVRIESNRIEYKGPVYIDNVRLIE